MEGGLIGGIDTHDLYWGLCWSYKNNNHFDGSIVKNKTEYFSISIFGNAPRRSIESKK